MSRSKARNQQKPSAPVRAAAERAKAGGERTGLRKLLLAAVVLVALVIAAYSNGLGNGFVWDDHQQVLNNPATQTGSPLSRIFTGDVRFDTHTQGVESSDYRPLQMLTYRLLMGAFGADATAFHACSLLLAIACALAALHVFWQLTREWEVAFAADVLFALYPVHTEAVDWIAALPELGFSLCFLLAFACFFESRKTDARITAQKRRLYAVLSWALFAGALLWKETAIVLPLVVLAYVLSALPRSESWMQRGKAALLASVPFWLVVAAYLALRFAVLRSVARAPRDWELSFVQQCVNLLALIEAYWAKLAWPFGLNAYYAFAPLRSLGSPRAISALVIAAAAVAGLIAAARMIGHSDEAPGKDDGGRRDAVLCAFAVCWVFITLLPAMHLAALGRNPFTERYLFLPSAGFCLLLVLLVRSLLRRVPEGLQRYAGSALLAAVAIAFLVTTIARNPDWKDDATLFRATLRTSPDAPFVHNMVATAESSDPAQADDAASHYEQSIALALKETPADRVDAVVALRGLAWIRSSRGDVQQALSLLDRAHGIAPQDADSDGERGLILAQAGHGKDALPFLQRALVAEPNNENVLSALGLITSEDLHDPQHAIGYLQQALSVHKAEDDFAASQHNNLATVYDALGNHAAATEQIRAAIRILPNDPAFHANLASALAAQGDMMEARSEAQTAVQLAPQEQTFQELLQKIDAAAAGR